MFIKKGECNLTVIGKKLKERRKYLNLTLEEVGEIVGVSKTTVQRWETGAIENMKRDKIALMAKALKTSPLFIMGLDNNPDVLVESPNKFIRINVLGSVPAGIPMEAIENIVDFEDIPIEWTKGGRKFIGLKVKGDSMYPKYTEGDTIIIQLQPDCDSGSDAVVFVNGNEATLKQIKKRNGNIILVPFNREYPEKEFKPDDKDEITIFGIVKELRRKIK
jgi:repressor LexA